VQGFVPLSKTVELIQRMHDVSIWVWSLNSKETIDKSLQQLGIEEKFTEFITRENAQYLKPDPTGFFITAGTNAKKDEFLMIGNSDSDRGAALAAGIQYIDVSEIEEID
jgi:HAD superfamily hydrolase (TIGR01549 family)